MFELEYGRRVYGTTEDVKNINVAVVTISVFSMTCVGTYFLLVTVFCNIRACICMSYMWIAS